MRPANSNSDTSSARRARALPAKIGTSAGPSPAGSPDIRFARVGDPAEPFRHRIRVPLADLLQPRTAAVLPDGACETIANCEIGAGAPRVWTRRDRANMYVWLADLESSFLDRVGKYEFHPAQPMWGYLPQVNQWGSTALEWEVERIGGKDHIPVFKAIPVYEGERLEVFAGVGDSKKAAKEKAAEQMALSGHC